MKKLTVNKQEELFAQDGTKRLIKRKQFEDYLETQYSV